MNIYTLSKAYINKIDSGLVTSAKCQLQGSDYLPLFTNGIRILDRNPIFGCRFKVWNIFSFPKTSPAQQYFFQNRRSSRYRYCNLKINYCKVVLK